MEGMREKVKAENRNAFVAWVWRSVRLSLLSGAYNEAMGQALAIEGAQQTGPDLNTIQPDITATLNGGRVEIPWGWGGNGAYLDMIELEADRNGQGFVFLANDTTPAYIDTTPFPGAPAKWTYRAIYRVGDSRVGQWSKPVTVTVGG